jgi:hypothetical protein
MSIAQGEDYIIVLGHGIEVDSGKRMRADVVVRVHANGVGEMVKNRHGACRALTGEELEQLRTTADEVYE